MKKIIISSVVVAIAIISVIFFACNKEKETSEKQASASAQNFIKLAHEGAVTHNEGLEYVYARLAEIKISENPLAVVENLTLDFIKTHSFFKSDIDAASKAAKTVFDKFTYYKKHQTKSSSTLWLEADESLLTTSQKMWLTQVNDVIDQNDDVILMAKSLDKIRDLVIKEGSEQEQYITIIAIEVTKETMDYWYNNYPEWERLLSEKPSKGWSWKDAAKSDVTGAIGGAIGGALGGGGAGAIPGAIGGACITSACNIVGQAMENWFGW